MTKITLELRTPGMGDPPLISVADGPSSPQWVLVLWFSAKGFVCEDGKSRNLDATRQPLARDNFNGKTRSIDPFLGYLI